MSARTCYLTIFRELDPFSNSHQLFINTELGGGEGVCDKGQSCSLET